MWRDCHSLMNPNIVTNVNAFHNIGIVINDCRSFATRIDCGVTVNNDIVSNDHPEPMLSFVTFRFRGRTDYAKRTDGDVVTKGDTWVNYCGWVNVIHLKGILQGLDASLFGMV